MMSLFKNFKKNEIDWVTLPEPNDSISFFETIKLESEKYWATLSPNTKLYGYQIQKDSKWRPGLTASEINEFELAMGFEFPASLKSFYSVMNGLSKHGINLYGNDGTAHTFRPVFYSYPDDLALIKDQISRTYEENQVNEELLKKDNVSRIFPVVGHRFMLVESPGNPFLSMHGSDIIYWAESLSNLLANEIFDNIYNVWEFESNPKNMSEINFWLD